jgi:hypothetical protein
LLTATSTEFEGVGVLVVPEVSVSILFNVAVGCVKWFNAMMGAWSGPSGK